MVVSGSWPELMQLPGIPESSAEQFVLIGQPYPIRVVLGLAILNLNAQPGTTCVDAAGCVSILLAPTTSDSKAVGCS